MRLGLRRGAPWGGLLLAAIAGFAGVARADDGPEVRILRPRNLATAIGPTQIRLLVSVPEGVSIKRVRIEVDGRTAATLTAPPWEIEWDAGDGSRGHRIDAAVVTSDNRTARSAVRTSALNVNEVERVDLVNLYLVVRDGQGRYVTDLEETDFEVFENKRTQTIDRFSTTHKPLRVGIVLDTSLTMRGDKIEKAKSAALQFLDILEPQDEGLVVTFSDTVSVAQELTRQRKPLAAAIERVEAHGGTALYDAVWRTARLLDDFDGRRVLVLLSDGRDEAANGFEPGSLHTLDEAVEQTLRSEVMVFAIALGNNLRKQYVRRWNPANGLSNLDPEVTVLDVLERLGDSTGGRCVVASGAGRLRKAFGEIASDLRHQYSIGYISDDPNEDGKWRRIDLLTPGRELEVITRKGYYAPRPGGKSRGR